jgi:hypothetical protein
MGLLYTLTGTALGLSLKYWCNGVRKVAFRRGKNTQFSNVLCSAAADRLMLNAVALLTC